VGRAHRVSAAAAQKEGSIRMASLIPYVLFLHVLGAILAFGPTFAYSIMGAMGGKEPQYANFSMRTTAAIGDKLVYPLAILQGVTGVLLVWLANIPLFQRPWLLAGIALYVFAISYAFTIQKNALHHAIELTSAPPPPGATGGPPPELMATVKKIQRGGMMLGLVIVVIVFLMVVKPGA
jgi:hypothetical protein